MEHKKPKTWKEARELPFISSIEKDPHPEPEELHIFIQLENGVDNPVTGETGGGFYVADFSDFISQLFFFWKETNSMEELQQEYDAWLKANVPAHWLKDDVADLSAENLMACVGYDDDPDYEWSPNKEQYAWLANFCERWRKEEQA